MCGGDQVEDTENGENKYGKKREHDKNFKGPIKNRSCTDIICCLLFLFFIAGMVAVSIVGFTRGDPITLLYPTNSDGEICGVGPQSGKGHLAYFDVTKCTSVGLAAIATGCPTPAVCVSSCPTTYYVYLELAALVTAGTASTSDFEKMLCKDGVSAETLVNSGSKTVSQLVSDDLCAAYYIPTTSIVGRCIPSIFSTLVNKAATLSYTATSGSSYNLQDDSGTTLTGSIVETGSDYLSQFYATLNYFELIFKDVLISWWLILVCLGGAVIVCFIWIVLLRWIAGIIVWFSIGALVIIWGYGTYYCYDRYYYLKTQGDPAGEYGLSQGFSQNLSYFLGLKKVWLAFGCSSATLLALFLLIFLFLVKRICIAIELIKEASRAIGNMIFTLVWPLVPFLLQVIFLAYFLVSAVYVASMGTAEKYNQGTNTTDDGVNYYLKRVPCSTDDATTGSVCQFVKYGGDEYIWPLEIFLLFMYFWGANFIIALSQMTLAGAFASYYFAFDKPKDIPAFPLMGGLWRSLRYHLGSLAFGSLLIAIVQIIRVMLEYLDHKLKGSENAVAKVFLKIMKCCMWCLEKFLRFLNKNAYILIAIRGRNFCLSAKDAFFLIMRNIVRVIVLDKVTGFVLFISKICIMAGVTLGCLYWFQGGIPFFTSYIPTLNFYFTPVIFVAIGTIFIVTCFFSVYSMAVDTLFICFLEDLEMNDGSAEKPYFMSKGMMKIMGKKNKLKDPEEKTDGKKNKEKTKPLKAAEPSSKPEPKKVKPTKAKVNNEATDSEW